MTAPKITKAALNAAGVFNSYEVARTAGKGAVHIGYRAYQRFYTAGWFVRRHGFVTDPTRVSNTVDTERNRLFEPRYPSGPAARTAALDEAKAWAGARYGITEWWRDPFGSWHPVSTRDAVLARLAGK